MITRILYKDQIQHLRTKGLWPSHDPEFVSTAQTGPSPNNEQECDGIVYQDDGDSGIAYQDDGDSGDEQLNDQMGLLFVNTNHVGNVALEDSSSEEDDC